MRALLPLRTFGHGCPRLRVVQESRARRGCRTGTMPACGFPPRGPQNARPPVRIRSRAFSDVPIGVAPSLPRASQFPKSWNPSRLPLSHLVTRGVLSPSRRTVLLAEPPESSYIGEARVLKVYSSLPLQSGSCSGGLPGLGNVYRFGIPSPRNVSRGESGRAKWLKPNRPRRKGLRRSRLILGPNTAGARTSADGGNGIPHRWRCRCRRGPRDYGSKAAENRPTRPLDSRRIRAKELLPIEKQAGDPHESRRRGALIAARVRPHPFHLDIAPQARADGTFYGLAIVAGVAIGLLVGLGAR